ncbi:hypothetical protein BGZ63DRAFT_494925 [Mariannaea sp. PMI_226]|nr:hypothetical protein BGZ63DRAFT_494925 [Mariannaea sp. PMI_226]
MSLQTPRKLWEHPNPDGTNMGRFKTALEDHSGKSFKSFHDMHRYSVTRRSDFWEFLWDYSGLLHEGVYTRVVDESARMDSIPVWFDGVKLNFAENLLLPLNGLSGKEDDKVAVSEFNELGPQSRVTLTWGELRRRVGQLAHAMKANGVVKGDRIATCSCNNIDTLVVFLATAAIGAIFSSSSTDIGVSGILQRLQQIGPRLVFMDDTALYNGKQIDLREKIGEVAKGLQTTPEFRGIVSQARFKSQYKDVSGIPMVQPLETFLSKSNGQSDLTFERVNFRDPFLIVYSSGTTGAPKCIVHSVGGTLLNAYKEGALHQEFGPQSTSMQYTTTSWIMYLAAVQTLLLGTHVILYDGSPFLPYSTALIELAAKERVTHFGTSPRYLEELRRIGTRPRELVNLESLQIVSSTGMIFPEALFEWFYDEGFPPHVRVNNQSGGTDIAGCFGLSNSLTPVHSGGCSGLGLGIPVEVYDSEVEGDKVSGRPIKEGIPGELVATAAFPNMPVMFWGPGGQSRYHEAYFSHFDGVWTHGDFIMIHPTTKQLFFLGRSDGILNPSGVRFGSSEIYNIIDKEFATEVEDSLCVGQRRPTDRDERVFLFLKMRKGKTFTNHLVEMVKEAIRKGLSARHVPKLIFPTVQIPVTINGKKVEMPVKRIISGEKIQPSGTLANPESLEYFYQFAKIGNEKAKSKL